MKKLKASKKAKDGVKVAGYDIPKGVAVHMEISAVMMSEKNFVEPHKFNPDRFVGKGAKTEALIPFGVGLRQCPGEALARAELFLIFTSILQNFRIKPEDPAKLPTKEAQMGLVLTPSPYKLRLFKPSQLPRSSTVA